jgi:5-amino-6-(5-phosphoribosylamino)uracil reductase
VLAISLDGRLAPAEGGAAQLGGRGDRRVLEEALAWADACLIGSETLRRHGTTCLIRDPSLLASRPGRQPQPIAIAVSRGRGLPADLPFFRQPLRRWQLILGSADSSAGRLDARGGRGADPIRIEAPGEELGYERRLCCDTWSAALATLLAAGQRRLVVLGGAALAASLVAEGLVDELQLSLCPLLLGGAHCWLPISLALPQPPPPPQPWRWQLIEQRPLEGGDLLLRYGRSSDGPWAPRPER